MCNSYITKIFYHKIFTSQRHMYKNTTLGEKEKNHSPYQDKEKHP